MASNPELQEELQEASMPNILALEASDSHEDLTTAEGNVFDPPVSTIVVIPKSKPETIVSKLQAALTGPRTITIPKPPTPAATSSPTSASSSASPPKRRGGFPRRQLQVVCEDGRVVSAPVAVGLPLLSPTASDRPASQSTAAALSQQHPEAAVAAIVEVVEDAVVTSSAEGELELPADQSEQTEWVMEVADDDQPTDATDDGGDQPVAFDAIVSAAEAADSADAVDAADAADAVDTVDAVDVVDVVDAVDAMDAMDAMDAEDAEDAEEASPLEPQLVLTTDRPLMETMDPSEVLNAVESAAAATRAARAAAVSHVVFESDGRAVGALMGQDGRQGKQQMMLAGGWPDVLSGNLLGTGADGDGRQIVLQVDEESDSVTLLVDRLEDGAVYELAPRTTVGVGCGELLELWERDGSGQDRHLETVSEVSLVDIRAVCEQCGCAISHHMVGLLARKDGSEYGYRCRLCQCVQTDVDEMARHMDSHRPLADTQCRFCSRGLRTFRPQSTRTYTCQACSMVFETRHEMIKHREVHPPKRRFPCELCDKAFQMKVQLEVHMRTHLGHKPYSCDMCPATFTQPSHLINHRRTHTGERPYACELCGRAFVQQGHLRAHERTHTGERPYKCDTCGRGFRQSGQLTAHKKLHEGEGPLKLRRRHGEPFTRDETTCPECGKTFRLPKDLRRHMLVHGAGSFRCETCGRDFKRLDHLRRHQRQHEKPPQQRQRRRRQPPQPLRQTEGLTRLDRVIDAVLDEPPPQEVVDAREAAREVAAAREAAREVTAATVKLEEDHSYTQVDMERVEVATHDAGTYEAVDGDGGDTEGVFVDGDAEDDDRVRSNTRVSRAPADALWSQTDGGDYLPWQQPERQPGRQPRTASVYGRRGALPPAPFTDDGVDEEMAMLTAALRDREAAARRRKGRGGASGRGCPPEPTVKLEPVNWEDWQPGEDGGQHGEDGDRRQEEDWAGAGRESTSGKRRRRRRGDSGMERAEDPVLDAWDVVDVTDDTPGGAARQSTARSWLPETQQVVRTSRRVTAGNWAANVGVSLTRSPHRGGKR